MVGNLIMPRKQSIPEAARHSYEAVTALINATCQARLNEEWARVMSPIQETA